MTIFIFLGGVRHGVYNREGSRGKMGAGDQDGDAEL